MMASRKSLRVNTAAARITSNQNQQLRNKNQKINYYQKTRKIKLKNINLKLTRIGKARLRKRQKWLRKFRMNKMCLVI